jgi:uncharacterized protein YndB with AHSA1/START domain
MTTAHILPADGKLDLVLERVVDVPPELVWQAWTRPEHIVEWFTPAPWKTLDCEIDLRPGGKFKTTMLSPEGEKFPNLGCYLDIVENRRLVWTDALLPGFRPSLAKPMNSFSYLTAIISLEPQGKGTKYTATALHRDAEDRKRHEEMGFFEGWGTVLDQLVALMRTKM